MPGHLECCWEPVAEWLGNELPAVAVSLRGGFWPGWHIRPVASLVVVAMLLGTSILMSVVAARREKNNNETEA